MHNPQDLLDAVDRCKGRHPTAPLSLSEEEKQALRDQIERLDSEDHPACGCSECRGIAESRARIRDRLQARLDSYT